MKLSVAKDCLLNNLSLVSKSVSTRTTLPILECVLLSAEGGFKLLANDLEMGIETAPIEAEIDEPGQVALNARMFTDIVRRMPGEFIYIQVDDNNIAVIKSGKAEFKIVGQSGDEFPFLPHVEKNEGCKIESSLLKDMIRQTIFSTATDETKPVLTGELVDLKDSRLRFVAVDGFRIAYFEAEIPTAVQDVHVVVPAKALQELSRVLPSSGEISFYFTDKHILFDMESCCIVSRLLEGEFIKYDAVFGEDFRTILHGSRSLLLAAFERACLISKDSKRSPVKLTIGDNSLVITSQTELGNSYDEIPVDIDGASLTIAFNPRYLIEVLRVIPDENVSLQFTTDLSPCIIRAIDSPAYKYLVLPLRMKS